ncbi:hypothetical protein C0991_008183 [Blastosporella zonata]|nr:hypothetical protein C0991_008183 [Blastosporella zonata]
MPSSPTGVPDKATERSEQIRSQPPASDNDVLVLQVRAFLEAGEDVDLDVETVEDIMQSLPAEFSEDVDPVGDIESADDDDGLESEEETGGDSYQLSNDVVPSVLYDVEEEGTSEYSLDFAYPIERVEDQQTWTAQEVEQMMHHLKERGMASWITEYVSTRKLTIPKLLRAFGIHLCKALQTRKFTTLLYFLKVALSRQLRKRDRLTQYNTISDAVNLIRSSRRIIILTGAGIIEDKNQLLRNYTQNIDTLETLAGVQHVLQCHGSFATASCLLCRRRVAGSEIEADIMNQKVALCTVCNPAAPTPKKKKRGKKKAKGQWDSDDEDESDGAAYPPGIMKVNTRFVVTRNAGYSCRDDRQPDITFFGEKLTDDFDNSLAEDRERTDLLLVIGTSLKVAPVADILSHLPHSVPQILINKTPIRHINPDIVLLGNADDIVLHLCDALEWELPAPSPAGPSSEHSTSTPRSTREQSKKCSNNKPPSSDSPKTHAPTRVSDSHVWLFDGAEGGRWLEDLKRELAAQTPSLTPLTVSSETNTRLPTPSPTPGIDSAAYRKRENMDESGEERAAKKARP